MARKPNYDFEKRQKELARKAKKDAKLEEKARRKREGSDGIASADEVAELTNLPSTESLSEIAGLPHDPPPRA